MAIHAVLVALPPALHGARTEMRQPKATSLEVRLARQTESPAEGKHESMEADAAPATEDKQGAVDQAGLVGGKHYFESSEVDVKAQPIELAPLVYPEAAYIRRMPGEVKVRVFIGASGSIDAVDILSADPPDMFEMAALDALLKTRFKPAELFGRPVASVKVVSIRFDPFQDQPPE